MTTFNELIAKHTAELLKDVTAKKMMTMDFLQLNKDAIKLAQTEFNNQK